MSSTIKKLGITYNSLNNRNTFTNGDVISGHVTVEVAKDCQIDSFYIKFKGKAEVRWTEGQGQSSHVYHSKDKYFSVRQYFIGDKNSKHSSVVTPGIHVYPFSFQFPLQCVRQINEDGQQGINCDQLCGKRRPEPSPWANGEGLKVLAYIKNDSSREIKPKYCIYRKHSFFAKRKRKVHTMDLLTKVGKPIPPSASENVAQVIAIPQDAEPSILNCDIIKAEHRLRVYLDVKYNSDPEIKFNIVILPPHQVPAMATAPSAASDFGNGPYGNYGNPHPLVWGFGPPQPPAGDQPAVPPPPYETYAMYPSMNDFASKC